MNSILAAWNAAGETAALDAMLACCGSKRWAEGMVALRPIASVEALSEAADRVWSTMQEADWLEAFACHPRIGEREPAHAAARATARRRFGRGRSSPRQARQANACWPNWPKEIGFMSSASASRISCARQAKAPARCWRFSSAAWRALATRSCARPPSNSGKSCKFV